MPSGHIYKKFCIDIITFKTEHRSKNRNSNMNVDRKLSKSQHKFICSICLNQKCINDKVSEINERKSRSCPVCQHSCTSIEGDSTVTKASDSEDKKVTKDAQTSKPDVTQGLSLLTEVLHAFQSKKQVNCYKQSRKTLILKDVGVSTEDIKNIKPKLSVSKIFHCSIDVESKSGNGQKFTIVSSSQPDKAIEFRKSLDLIKHKSSSIPQMKLEELKNSLKEKTKSKDVMEEANRMFATMKRVEDTNGIENRPLIRSGPRVLPVVKTNNCYKTPDNQILTHSDQPCKCCRENNFHMSSGDSSERPQCYHKCKKCVERCDDCVYMCCHYKQNKQMREIICKRSGTVKNETDGNH